MAVRGRWASAAVLAVAGLVVSGLPAVAVAAPAASEVQPQVANPLLPQILVRKVQVDNTNRHLQALQRIADQNGGTRAVNTPGYDESVRYVSGQLRRAGFDVQIQPFVYQAETTVADTLTVDGVEYEAVIMDFSPQTPEGGLTGPLAVVPEDETTGCEASDFASQDYTGTIALIRRGGCTFLIKEQNAAAAGAVAAVVSNNVDGDVPVAGTLGEDGEIPTAGLSQNDGTALMDDDGEPATLDVRFSVEDVTTYNVIAQTRTGRTDNMVMSGAHLDSVEAGPGINDNGSGSAGQLEIALQLGGSPKVNNAVRFAWWGAEELGLLGSTAYVASLSFEQQLDIALYLNFDMIGSPNAAYFVYDGDDSDGEGAGPGPEGSAAIEQAFVAALGRQGVPTRGTDFSGRSDYGPFIAVGIPAGGLFTGAEGIKTEEEAALWGGLAGVAYDPCYHQSCDTLGNPNRTALDRNSDAAARVIGQYALSTKTVNGGTVSADRAGSSTTVAPFSQGVAA